MKAIRKLFWNCWYLIWSCVPGCGQMCLGYMKRGISQMIIFCALTFIAVFLEMGPRRTSSCSAFPTWTPGS